MKLLRIEASNFLTFGDPGIEVTSLPDVSVIVGPNASGKTNFLRAIQFVGDVFANPQISLDQYVHQYDPQRLVSLVVDVSLSTEEVESFADLMMASTKSEVRNLGRNNVDQNQVQMIGRSVLNLVRPTFVKLFSRPLRFVVKGRASASDPLDAYVEILDLRRPLYLTNNGISSSNSRATGFSIFNVGEEAVTELEKRRPGILGQGASRVPLPDSEIERMAAEMTLDWFLRGFDPAEGYPKAISSTGVDLTWYDNQIGASSFDVVRLRKFLSSRSWGSRGIGMRSLAALMFQSSVVRLSDLRSAPRKVPIPPIESIQLSASPVDGSNLSSVLFRLKNSNDPRERFRFYQLIEFYRRFTGYYIDVVVESHAESSNDRSTVLSISEGRLVANEPAPKLVQTSSLRWSNEKVQVPAELAAAGLVELLVSLQLVLCHSDSVILLDEPALNLHATKQRELLEAMTRAAGDLHNQLVIVSHSPAFVAPEHAVDLLRFTTEKGRTRIYRVSGTQGTDTKAIIRDLQRTPILLTALFSNKVLLVEGGSEAAALPIWFRKLARGRDLAQFGVEIIDAGGQGSLAGYARVLDAWGIPFRIVSDARAKNSLGALSAKAAVYPYDDLSDLLETECPDALRNALKELKPRNGAKAPAIAREVALFTKAPRSIVALWTRLRRFLTTPVSVS